MHEFVDAFVNEKNHQRHTWGNIWLERYNLKCRSLTKSLACIDRKRIYVWALCSHSLLWLSSICLAWLGPFNIILFLIQSRAIYQGSMCSSLGNGRKTIEAT